MPKLQRPKAVVTASMLELSGRTSVCAPIYEDRDYETDSVYDELTVGNTRELLEEPDRESIANGESWALSRKALGPKFEVAGVLKKRSIQDTAGNGGNQRVAVSATASASAPAAGPAATKAHIQTVVRVRPVEFAAGLPLSLAVLNEFTVQTTAPPSARAPVRQKSYQFAKVLDATATQEQVFHQSVHPLLAPLFDPSGGRSGLVIAYGATNAGKTHTVLGPPRQHQEGLLPRTLAAVYERMENSVREVEAAGVDDKPRFCLHMRVAEVYNNHAYDLLFEGDQVRARALKVRQDGTGRSRVEGLSRHTPLTMEGALELVRRATDRRQTSATRLNAKSSRGHTIWMMELEQVSDEGGPEKEEGDDRVDSACDTSFSRRRPPKRGGVANTSSVACPRLWIVDMAGSERIDRAVSDSIEASHINRDHTALFTVLQKTSTNAQHVSFRDRTLTFILMDMLLRETAVPAVTTLPASDRSGGGGSGGLGRKSIVSPRSACVMVVNVHPASSEFSETQKVLDNAILSMNAKPVVGTAGPPCANNGTYGLDGHYIAKRQKIDTATGRDPDTPSVRSCMVASVSSAQGQPERMSFVPWSERVRPGEPVDSRRMAELEAEVVRLKEMIRECEDREARIEQEAIDETRIPLIVAIEKLESQNETLHKRLAMFEQKEITEANRQQSLQNTKKRHVEELHSSVLLKLDLLEESESQVTRLTNALAQAESESRAAIAALTESEAAKENLETEVKVAQVAAADECRRAVAADEALAVMQEKLADSKAVKEKLENELQAAQAAATEESRRAVAADEALADLEEKLAACGAERVVLEKELSDARGTVHEKEQEGVIELTILSSRLSSGSYISSSSAGASSQSPSTNRRSARPLPQCKPAAASSQQAPPSPPVNPGKGLAKQPKISKLPPPSTSLFTSKPAAYVSATAHASRQSPSFRAVNMGKGQADQMKEKGKGVSDTENIPSSPTGAGRGKSPPSSDRSPAKAKSVVTNFSSADSPQWAPSPVASLCRPTRTANHGHGRTIRRPLADVTKQTDEPSGQGEIMNEQKKRKREELRTANSAAERERKKRLVGRLPMAEARGTRGANLRRSKRLVSRGQCGSIPR